MTTQNEFNERKSKGLVTAVKTKKDRVPSERSWTVKSAKNSSN